MFHAGQRPNLYSTKEMTSMTMVSRPVCSQAYT